eukprot:TRINITY_DN13941_c0_g1_i2.p1 TRINITY_DN13941_c0_g1~~TRINITY_DN13941_c0_g1_i2.p1  ORF type:complete len:2114 (+),score=477.33 TRINITY_DN13941_c0_g1_i2:55-6396(+)
MRIVGQTEPIYVRIKNILREYNHSTIIQEFIQNADDARASNVVCIVDSRSYDSFLLSPLVSHCAGNGALVIYNDSLFSEKDIEGLLSLGVGNKRDRSDCTGQFGLGFNSAYSISETPILFSGNNFMVLDPSEKYLPNLAPGVLLNLEDKQDEDVTCLLRAVSPVFESLFEECSVQEDPQYFLNGTMFILPIRTNQQALSSLIYKIVVTATDLEHILDNIRDQYGSDMLQFLKVVQKLRFLRCQEDGGFEELWLASVAKEIICSSAVEILTFSDRDVGSVWVKMDCSEKLVDAARELNELEQSPFTFRPKSSVSMRLVDFNPVGCTGRIFSGLPTPVLSFLPIHVNGVFELSADRKQLHIDSFQGWNSVVVKSALAPGYAELLFFLAHNSAFLPDENWCNLFPISEQNADAISNDFSLSFYSFVKSHKSEIFRGVSATPTYWSFDLSWFCFKGSEMSHLKEIFRWFDQNAEEIVLPCVFVPTDVFDEMNRCDLKPKKFTCQKLVECFESLKNESPSTPINEHVLLAFLEYLFLQECGFDCLVKLINMMKKRCLYDFNVLDRILQRISEKDHGTKSKFFSLFREYELVPDRTGFKKASELLSCESALFEHFSNVLPFTSSWSKSALDILKKLGLRSYPTHRELICCVGYIEKVSKDDEKRACEGAISLVSYISQNFCQVFSDRTKKSDFLNKASLSRWVPVEKSHPLSAMCGRLDGNFVPIRRGEGSPKARLLIGLTCSIPLQAFKVQVKSGELHELFEWDSDPSPHLVKNNLLRLQELWLKCPVDSTQHLSYFEDVAKASYSFLMKRTERLSREHLLWTGRCFRKPENLSVEKLPVNMEPYIESITNTYRFDDNLRKWLVAQGAKSQLRHLDFLQVLEGLGKNSLANQDFDLAIEVIRYLHSQKFSHPNMLLVNQNHELIKASDSYYLSFEKFEEFKTWLKTAPEARFCVAKEIATHIAMNFGSKSLVSHFARSTGTTPFGVFEQKESWVRRLKGVISNDVDEFSVFREFIQNADDSGATDMTFIVDHDRYFGKKLVEENMKLVQGPALLILNNQKFSARDFEGLRNISNSYKADDPRTIGRFGIGFNIAYRYSDFPQLLSDEKCVFLDPTLRLGLGCSGSLIDLESNPWLKSQFGDTFSPFLASQFSLKNGIGNTIFRLSLRDVGSDISDQTFSPLQIERIMKNFVSEAEQFLLNLNNIKKVSFVSKRDYIFRTQEEFSLKVLEDCGETVVEVCNSRGFRTRWVCSKNAEGNHLVSLKANLACGEDAKYPLFCYFPLRRQKTTFPIVIHGTFKLDYLRTHVLYDDEKTVEDQVRFNQNLANDVIPSLYADLLATLGEKFCTTASQFWRFFPQYGESTLQQDIACETYRRVFSRKCLWNELRTGEKMLLGNVSLIVSSQHEKLAFMKDLMIETTTSYSKPPEVVQEFFARSGTNLTPVSVPTVFQCLRKVGLSERFLQRYWASLFLYLCSEDVTASDFGNIALFPSMGGEYVCLGAPGIFLLDEKEAQSLFVKSVPFLSLEQCRSKFFLDVLKDHSDVAEDLLEHSFEKIHDSISNFDSLLADEFKSQRMNFSKMDEVRFRYLWNYVGEDVISKSRHPLIPIRVWDESKQKEIVTTLSSSDLEKKVVLLKQNPSAKKNTDWYREPDLTSEEYNLLLKYGCAFCHNDFELARAEAVTSFISAFGSVVSIIGWGEISSKDRLQIHDLVMNRLNKAKALSATVRSWRIFQDPLGNFCTFNKQTIFQEGLVPQSQRIMFPNSFVVLPKISWRSTYVEVLGFRDVAPAEFFIEHCTLGFAQWTKEEKIDVLENLFGSWVLEPKIWPRLRAKLQGIPCILSQSGSLEMASALFRNDDSIATDAVRGCDNLLVHRNWMKSFPNEMTALIPLVSADESSLRNCIAALISLYDTGLVSPAEYRNRVYNVFSQFLKFPSTLANARFLPRKRVIGLEKTECKDLGRPVDCVHGKFYNICWTSRFVFDCSIVRSLSPKDHKPEIHDVCQHLINLNGLVQELEGSLLQDVCLDIYNYLQENLSSIQEADLNCLKNEACVYIGGRMMVACKCFFMEEGRVMGSYTRMPSFYEPMKAFFIKIDVGDSIPCNSPFQNQLNFHIVSGCSFA